MQKNSSKRNVIEDNYHSNKFLNELLVGFTKFLNRILSSISKSHIPKYESIYLFEKARYFCGKNLSIEEFWHECERLLSGLSTSLDLQIPPNLELILGN